MSNTTDKTAESYDLEQVYDEQIAPLMTQIIQICEQHKLPMIASFAYACDDEGGYDHCTTSLGPKERVPDDYKACIAWLMRQYTPGRRAE